MLIFYINQPNCAIKRPFFKTTYILFLELLKAIKFKVFFYLINALEKKLVTITTLNFFVKFRKLIFSKKLIFLKRIILNKDAILLPIFVNINLT